MRSLETVLRVVKQFIPVGYEAVLAQMDKVADRAAYKPPEAMAEVWQELALVMNAGLPDPNDPYSPVWSKIVKTITSDRKYTEPPIFRVTQVINQVRGDTLYIGTDYKKAVEKLIKWHVPDAHRYFVELSVWVDGQECDHPLMISKPNNEKIAELKRCIGS